MSEETVNHPSHYVGNTSLECIDVMKLIFCKTAVYDFCLCNAFKYIWRYKFKGGMEDLKKAEWYLDEARDDSLGDPTFAMLDELVQERLKGEDDE